MLNDHGLGDTIQFARYLPMMISADAEPTLLRPPNASVAVLARAASGSSRQAPEGESFDAQIAISSLPRAFATRLDSVPAPVPYLRAEPEVTANWAARIGAGGFKIGVVWQGNPNPEADMARSMPLAALRRSPRAPGARLISLQKGFGVEQLADLPAGMRVESLGEDFDAGPDAFVDAAAAMRTSTSSSPATPRSRIWRARSAGPVWVALKKDAEWRWLRDRDDSPWYPTMRLFRQKRRGDWSGVFAEMAARLGSPAENTAPERLIAIPGAVGELIDKITILEIKLRRIVDDRQSHAT